MEKEIGHRGERESQKEEILLWWKAEFIMRTNRIRRRVEHT